MTFPEVPEDTAQPLPRFPADELRARYEQHFSDRWTTHAANTHALIEMVEEYNDLVDALFVKQENTFNDDIEEMLKAIEKEEEEQGIVPDTAVLPSALPRRSKAMVTKLAQPELNAKLAAFFESMRNNFQTFLA
ncbi:hypothetical protein HDU87_008028 [Geranomyces variabilis]|uniref:Uncharacterized protein n=1 Tax=Geranomyces variabilis TaxID=109894 RepID=A0AAD5XPP1_9FUNG|nr:hypothetical protein HDU87_008028 [Geranomyces variabilis]